MAARPLPRKGQPGARGRGVAGRCWVPRSLQAQGVFEDRTWGLRCSVREASGRAPGTQYHVYMAVLRRKTQLKAPRGNLPRGGSGPSSAARTAGTAGSVPPPAGHPAKRGPPERPRPGPAPRPRACALRPRRPRPSLPRPRGRRHAGRPGGAGGGRWPARLAADNAAAMSPSQAGAAAAAAGPRARPGGLGFGLPPVPGTRAGGQRGSSGSRSEGCGASLSSRAA